jgi:predicted AlkP superfamily phosphohydrolase/phosphomutase
MIPRSKSIKKSTYIINKSESVAKIADFAGNNPFGGIEISREAAAANGLEYEAVRDDLVAALGGLTDPDDGKPVVDWVKKREELPDGEGRGKFPDIVYRLRADYGTQRAMYTSILGRNLFHRKISGGHREGGILVAHGPRLNGDGATLPDLRPTILDLLDVEEQEKGDGRSLVR